jgi:trans-2,3-dihydro-3-hydroxyanthranilate isomerase
LAATPFANVVAYVPHVAPHAARARVFAPGIGVMEDPATGTACGALAAGMVDAELTTPSAARHMVITQGMEMGRPSQVHVMLKCEDKKPVALRIGGLCVWTGRGEIHVVEEPGRPREVV